MIHTVFRTGSRASWRQASSLIIKAARNELCSTPHGKVRHQYVQDDALPASDFILYKQTPDGQVSGFLLGQYKGSKVYVIVVCSKERGLGKTLIHETLRIGRSQGHTHAGLHALPHVTGYYPRFGFSFPDGRKVGSDIDGYYMEKNLSNTVNWFESPADAPQQVRRSPRYMKRLATVTPDQPRQRRARIM